MITDKAYALRMSLLSDFLNLNGDFRLIREELLKLKWDYDEVIVLTREHLIKLLSKYISGEFTNKDIVDWTNVIESREDIGYESLHEEMIKELIFQLANPEINSNLDQKKAMKYLSLLS